MFYSFLLIACPLHMHDQSFNIHKTLVQRLNPLSPHDALKHHFTSLKTDLIFLQQTVLKQYFYETG